VALNAKWDELFGTGGSGASMTLASAKAPGGGGGEGGPDLKADQGPWTKSGGVAAELRTMTSNSLTDLTAAGEGVAGGTAGFASTGTLNDVLQSWKTRLTAVRDECGRLEGALTSAGKEFGEREVTTRDRIARSIPPQQAKSGS
jgi:hypothetical protein